MNRTDACIIYIHFIFSATTSHACCSHVRVLGKPKEKIHSYLLAFLPFDELHDRSILHSHYNCSSQTDLYEQKLNVWGERKNDERRHKQFLSSMFHLIFVLFCLLIEILRRTDSKGRFAPITLFAFKLVFKSRARARASKITSSKARNVTFNL